MIKRTILEVVKSSLLNFPVVVITGPRQVGKSTLVYSFVESMGYRYVSLDNVDQRRLAIEDPRYFIESKGYPLIIDEVQFAPQLLEIIQEIVNNKRINGQISNGLFILTGSQAFQLMEGVTQSMAGRAAILTMEPLSRREIMNYSESMFIPNANFINHDNDALSVTSVFEQIINGFYPELYKNKQLKHYQFYEQYISTYIDRDVTAIINIKNKQKFHAFMQILASLTGQQLNVASIANSLGVHSATIKEWLSVLETSGIIYLLQSYNDVSIIKRVVRSPKIYFSDTGIAAHLIRINDAETLEVSYFAGQFMETFVMNEIRKSYLNNGKRFNGNYYRDSNQNEIDLILIENVKVHFVEIKKGMNFSKQDIKTFDKLSKVGFEMGHHCILCNTPKNYGIDRNISVLSIECIGS